MNLCLLAEQGHIPAAAAHAEPLDGYHVSPLPGGPWQIPFPVSPSPNISGQNPDERCGIDESPVENSPEKVNILALGPLTKSARSLRRNRR